MRALGHWSLLSSLRLLLLICVVAGAARVYVAAEKPLNYDEYWHILVAQQDTREGLAREWRSNAHPPLYYWLLRLLVSLARGPLVDRSISLLAGVLAVLVIGQILVKVAKDPMVAPLGAFAFALAPSAVLISSEVRSYMLCTLFLLVAFRQYVGLVKGPPSFRALVIFSGASCLALMSHYFTVFFLAAGLAAAVWVAATRLSAGEGLGELDRWGGAALAAALPILGVGYISLSRSLAQHGRTAKAFVRLLLSPGIRRIPSSLCHRRHVERFQLVRTGRGRDIGCGCRVRAVLGAIGRRAHLLVTAETASAERGS